jgi:uncharacterized protein YbjT (DUF2867 family)
MFVVAGVTGKTGRVVAETLLAHRKPVRVLLRDPAKAAPWTSKGAQVAVGSFEAGGLARALAGASGAYVLVPPQYAADDVIAAQRPVADAIAKAVRESGLPHVVLLSSMGAQHAEGTGPVRSLHYAEDAVGRAAKTITILRAAYFLENWVPVLGEAKAKGVLLSFLKPGQSLPMVATQDIGRAAADALLDPAPARRVIELVGPAEWTPEEIADALAAKLGRSVRVEGLPAEAIVPAFMASGMSRGTAELFTEMYAAVHTGRLGLEGGKNLLRFGTLTPGEALAPFL